MKKLSFLFVLIFLSSSSAFAVPPLCPSSMQPEGGVQIRYHEQYLNFPPDFARVQPPEEFVLSQSQGVLQRDIVGTSQFSCSGLAAGAICQSEVHVEVALDGRNMNQVFLTFVEASTMVAESDKDFVMTNWPACGPNANFGNAPCSALHPFVSNYQPILQVVQPHTRTPNPVNISKWIPVLLDDATSFPGLIRTSANNALSIQTQVGSAPPSSGVWFGFAVLDDGILPKCLQAGRVKAFTHMP